MKPSNETLVDTITTIDPANRTRLSLDESSFAFIMKTLTDLYSDPELAVVREYSTNALDSHRGAGNPNPIEIELPSDLNPIFIVRDHGLGLSHDELRNHYSKYGASSKRDTNEQVGLLGLGCKAALTYTNQFFVIGIKDGIKTTVLLTRDEDGAGSVQVLDTCGTSEPNGVEVQVPIKDRSSFNATATDFFRFWEKGTILVDGAEPEGIFDSHVALDPDVSFITDGSMYHDYIVMGNIPYPTERRISSKIVGQAYVAVRVDIGSIDHTPSREALNYTDKTREVLATAREFVDSHIDHYVNEQITSAPTRLEALKAYHSWKEVVRISTPKWNGQPLPYSVTCNLYRYSPGSNCKSGNAIEASTLIREDICLVTDHPQRSLNASEKDRLRELFPKVRNFYVLIDQLSPKYAPWVEDVPQITSESLKLLKVPKERAPRVKRVNKWDLWTGYSFDGTDDIDEENGQIAYILRSDTPWTSDPNASWRSRNKTWTKDEWRPALGRYLTSYKIQLVVIAKSDLEKFLSEYPSAVSPSVAVQNYLNLIEDQLTDDQIAVYGKNIPRIDSYVDPEKILDPDVAIAILRTQEAKTPEAHAIMRIRESVLLNYRGFCENPPVGRDVVEYLEACLTSYPLVGGKVDQDEVEYINALYLYRKNQGDNQS